MAQSGFVPRQLEPAVRDQLDRFPAVALFGARQVGKSTLVRLIACSVRPSCSIWNRLQIGPSCRNRSCS